MKKFLKKYCFITMPIIAVVIFTFFSYVLGFNTNIEEMKTDNMGILIGIAGSLIGFLFTANTIFLSLPKDTDMIKRVKRSKHHIIFNNCVSLGIILASIAIIFWICGCSSSVIVMLFVESLTETLIAAYYINMLCIYNF